MATSYIGMDVSSRTLDIAVERNKAIVWRHRVPTSIEAVRKVLHEIPGRKELTFEEGPLAHWLYRNLRDHVDKLVVCDPARNAYIAKDGDKDDPIDAAKLAPLLRGRYLREVYHSDDEERVALKRWVALYHDRVRQAVREINKFRGCCRIYGVSPTAKQVRDPETRKEWLPTLDDPVLVTQLEVLAMGYDVAEAQRSKAERELQRRSRAWPIIKLWQALPGIGPIRAATLLAYLDTPWRFRNPSALCKYCGVGLVRHGTGTDKHGHPKTGRLKLAWNINKRLKDAVMGAAKSAIANGSNPFADHYDAMVGDGKKTSNAKHTVARKLLLVLWGMWKTGCPYDPSLVRG